MRVYTYVVINIATGQTLLAESHEYSGSVAQAKGGAPSQSSKPGYVIPSLLPDIKAGAQHLITDPAMGKEVTIPGAKGGYSIPMTLTDVMMNRAINNIRGGYAARGLAGSGIAAGGEQEAIGQLALQGAQQQATNLTNLLSAGTGQTSKSSGGGGGLFGK